MNNQRTIFFNEALHKYTDEFNNVYTSTTTMIGKYETKFEEKALDIAQACERIGRNPNHPKYLLYKGKRAVDILKDWKNSGKIACDKGNRKHNFLETSIKAANGYKKTNGLIDDRIYTVTTILNNHNYGRVDLDFFEKLGVKERYPSIYDVIEQHVKEGYNLYPEIGAYIGEYLVSGLLDVFMVKLHNKHFKVLDWKTNLDALNYESGYYVKNLQGGRTNQFVRTQEYFKEPISHLEASNGNKYTLQLSVYDYMAEYYGFIFEENILCHIQNVLDYDGLETDEEVVNIHTLPYFKNEVDLLIKSHYNSIKNKLNVQYKCL